MNTIPPNPQAGPAPQPAPAPQQNPIPPRPPAVDGTRPFGAHVRMSWWKPIVIVVLLLVLMFGIQIVLGLIVGMIEIFALGRDPMSTALSPLMFLTANISLALMAPIAIALMRWIGKVPVRQQLSLGRRLSWGRLGLYAGAFAVLVVLTLAVATLIEPATIPVVDMGAGAFLLLAIVVLTTPFQAAAEEIMFRGAIMPAVASWIRPAKAALVLGLVVSSVIFGLTHGSLDPWLLSYYTIFGACMAVTAVISRGLEAPIAFHVVNNFVLLVISAIGSGDGSMVIDRSVGQGGPFMLLFIAMDVVAVALVWLHERRRRAAGAAPVRGGVAQPTA